MENNVSYVPDSPESFPETAPAAPLAPQNVFVTLALAGTYIFGTLVLLPLFVVVAIVFVKADSVTMITKDIVWTPILWILGLSLASYSIGNTLSYLDRAVRRLRIVPPQIAFGSVVWALLAVSMAISAFNAFVGKSVVGMTWEFISSLFARGGKSDAGYIIMGLFWTLIALIASAIALIVSKAKTLYCYSAEQ